MTDAFKDEDIDGFTKISWSEHALSITFRVQQAKFCESGDPDLLKALLDTWPKKLRYENSAQGAILEQGLMLGGGNGHKRGQRICIWLEGEKAAA